MVEEENAPEQENEVEEKSSDNAGDNWQDTLTDEQKASPSFTKFKGKSPSDLFASYLSVENMIGREKMVFPKSEVEFSELYGKLGRPDTADEYKVQDIELPEGMKKSDDFEKDFKEASHKLNLTQEQVEGLHSWYNGNQSKTFTNGVVKIKAEMDNAEAELRTEYGEAYETKLIGANRAIQEFGGEDLVSLLDKTGLGRNPHVVKTFVNVGMKLMEDSHLSGGENGKESPVEIQSKINEVMRSPQYLSTDPVVRQAAVRQVNDLFKLKMKSFT